MSYALPADVRAFTTNADVIALDDATLAKYIAASEADVDRACGFGGNSDIDATRRFDPPSLVQADRDTLVRAVSAQVEYRVVMGDDFFTRAQFKSVSGPEFTTQGMLPRIGPRVYDELAGSGILKLTTTWGAQGDSPRWYSFAYNVDED